MKFIWFICLMVLMQGYTFVSAAEQTYEPPIRVVTSEFPPYSFSAGGHADGVAVALVETMLDQMGLNINIEVYPWARAYEIAQREPNTLLFLVARTPERESLFQWVGRLMMFDVKVFRRKGANAVVLNQLQDMQYYKVGSLIKDVKGTYLKQNGIKTIDYASEDSGIHMLWRGYLDLMPAEFNSFRYRVSKLGYQQDDFEVAYELREVSNPLYLAFSQNTSEAVVERFRAALSRLPLDQGLLDY